MDLHYEFPKITHLNDIRPAIEGSDEFIIAERDWGFVVNYLVNKGTTFPDINDELSKIRRECRGLKFNKEGELLSRPYHKFFNANERESLQLKDIDLSKPHVIMEKLDGSLIHPIFVDRKNSHWRLCTKMGITDISMQAEEFVSLNVQYKLFIEHCLTFHMTCMFEWCSRKNKVVIDHPIDRLVLTAIRYNDTGDYMSYENMMELATLFGIDFVKVHDGSFNNINELVEFTKNMKDTEGFIVRFNDGHMIKIKSDDYVRIHKAKDSILHEKNVIDLIVNDKLDDILPSLLESDAKNIVRFRDKFWDGISNRVNHFRDANFILLAASNFDRKTFATTYAPKVESFLRSFIFSRFNQPWTNEEIREFIVDIIKRNVNTQSSVDKVRYLWYDAEYKPYSTPKED